MELLHSILLKCRDRKQSKVIFPFRSHLNKAVILAAFTLFSPHFVFSIECKEPSTSVSASGSSQIGYFTALLKKGMRAEFIEFLRLWYPERKGSSEETYFFKCQRSPWRGLIYSPGRYLNRDCTPDVLFSWGPFAKVLTLQSTAADGKLWEGTLNDATKKLTISIPLIYATMSPVATYQYGLVPIRFKIKKHIPFWGASSIEVKDGMVTYFDWGGNDFVFLKGDVLENWSFGTPEHYDEIVRDIQNYIDAIHGGITYESKEGVRSGSLNSIFNMTAYDGHTTGETVLKSALLEMIRMILNNEGRIFYNQDSCRNRRRVFQTDKVTYFNPFKYDEELPPIPLIKILEASYGLNLDASKKGNGTQSAAVFCDQRVTCPYKIRTKYLGLPEEGNENGNFEISWICGASPQIHRIRQEAPSAEKEIVISCADD